MKDLTSKYIVIEGPIGVGKTSLSNKLALEWDAELILENVDDNPFLTKFYKNPREVSLQTQLYFLLTRTRQVQGFKQQDIFSKARVSDFMLQKDRLFEREESNIFCQIPISITTAILGGDVDVPTIEGKKARLNIPPGTQSETQFRLRGKGMSILRQTRRGDMYVETNVEIPVNLNNKQKAILQEFEKEGGTSKKHSPKSQSFFSKLKEVWEDLT